MSVQNIGKTCLLCKKEVPLISLSENQNDISIFNKIKQMFRVNFDPVQLSHSSICQGCRYDIDESHNLYEMCRSKLSRTNSFPSYSKMCQEIGIQSGNPKNILIINQLPDEITEHELKDEFSGYGTLENVYLKVLCHRDTFARLTFSSEEDARRASQVSHFFKKYNQMELVRFTLVSSDEAPIDRLPDICLLEIFKKLEDSSDRLDAERVCKRWKRVALKSWCNFTGVHYQYTSWDCSESLLSRCGLYLKHVDVQLEDDLFLKSAARHCPNLESFRIWCHFDDKVSNKYIEYLKKILENSTKLRCFSIINVQPDFVHDSLQCLTEEASEIRLFGKDSVITSIDVSKFTKLIALELIQYELRKDDMKGIEKLINLKYLSFMQSSIDPGIIRRITHFKNLTLLEIPDCQIRDDTLIKIVQNNQNLTHLDVSGNKLITDRSMMYITDLPDLNVLIINGLPHVTGRYLKRMPKLSRLHCNDCHGISDLELLILIDSSPKIRRIYASGIATQRLIASTIETVRNIDGRKMYFSVHKPLYDQWCEENPKNGKVEVYEDLADPIDPIFRDYWYA